MQPVYCQEPSLHSYIHPACWTHDEQGKQDNLTLPHSHVTAKNETFNNTECKLVTTARSDGMGAKFNQEDRERERQRSYLNPPHLCIQVILLYWPCEYIKFGGVLTLLDNNM